MFRSGRRSSCRPLLDDAAAEDFVAVRGIEDSGLSGGDAGDAAGDGAAVREEPRGTAGASGGAHFDQAVESLGRDGFQRKGREGHVRHLEVRADSFVGGADDDAVAAGVEGDDVVWGAAASGVQTLALTDRVMPEAVVLAEDAAGGVDDLAGSVGFSDELVLVAGVEVLAVAGVGRLQTMAAGDGADFVLGEFSEREELSGELLLGEPVEEVALVLGGVTGGAEGEAVAVTPDARVVARGESLEVEAAFAGEAREKTELHQGVAADAGVGGASGEVGFAEVPQDGFRVGVVAVEDVVRDADALRKPGGALDVAVLVGAKAASPLAAAVESGAPELHGDADDVMALLLEEQRRDAGVDAPG